MFGSPDRTLLGSALMDVERFHHEVTGLPMPAAPQMLLGERKDYANLVIKEELQEFNDATTIADQADALVDLCYFSLGRLLEMGFSPGAAFETVQRSNILKTRGPNKRGNVYEAAKPEGWRPPDWDLLLNITHADAEWLRDQKEQAMDYIAGETIEVVDHPSEFVAGPVPGHPRDHRLKILLLGYGRHGKDTAADYLRERYGMTFTSSSLFCAQRVMMPYFAHASLGPVYKNADECFADRHNHRAEWFQQIEAFNTPDKASLGRAIFAENDIYCGLRSAKEFHAVKAARLYDWCLWIDRSDHVKPEGKESCTVEPWMADLVIDNNGTPEELYLNLDRFMKGLGAL